MNQTLHLLFTTLLCACCLTIQAQDFNETINKTAQFSSSSDKTISVHNVYGSVEIVGYSGTTAMIEVDKSIDARNSSALARAKEELGVQVIELDNAVIVYLDSPFSSFDVEKRRYKHEEQYRNSRRKYEYTFDFKIKVPFNTNVEAFAMNDGDILIKDIQTSEIVASNLNGKISLDNVAGAIDVNALNEDIDVSYHSNPTEDSYFNSLNGDINVTVQAGLSADAHFKSLNGKFYSNIETSPFRTVMNKEKAKNKHKVKYKLSSKNQYKFGSGGPELYFELLNGDVHLDEK